LIVDDHVLFAEAISAALREAGMGVSASVTNGRDAIAFLENDHADVVLMDIGLPDRSGLAVGREMLERWPETKLVAVTALDDPRAVDEALEAGFRGYLTKDTPVGRFISSMEAVVGGQVVLPHRLVPTGHRRASDGIALLVSQLTTREREVLSLLVEGADGGTIARRLGISRNTVRTHVQSILTKLQVHSRLEAATMAVRHHLVPLPSSAIHRYESGPPSAAAG
jgi:two-component system, NarL family, nitrate/nitrite response regulator NarL